ncbi:hypothetical protein DYB32_003003 [Aphanomyces invadans]|uniref:Magnesium transporter n=1 Tax=Aphanomyces invadans TaxID=157072 RepID=A0A418B1R4_9STRA|nr:hypothetical protein DYB32_003003 [Aphanomyces invadans]
MAHGGFGGGTTLVESLMHNDMLVSKDGEILGMNAAGGKRLVPQPFFGTRVDSRGGLRPCGLLSCISQAVHMRDIRKMDNIFSTSNEPSITVRQQAILVNCGPAVEAILATICRLFSTECDRIVPKGRAALDKVTKDDSMMSELENLRSIKNEMSSLESRVGGMRRLLMAFLENEEDLHMMYLTKVASEIYGTQTRVALMANNILNTESIVMLKLDSKRNFLLSVDLSLTLLGTLVALPTFIVGGFGMNLNSTIQDTDYIFWIVFGVCVAIMVLGYVYTQQYLKRQGINMSWKY